MTIVTDACRVPPGHKVKLKHWPTRVQPLYRDEPGYARQGGQGAPQQYAPPAAPYRDPEPPPRMTPPQPPPQRTRRPMAVGPRVLARPRRDEVSRADPAA